MYTNKENMNQVIIEMKENSYEPTKANRKMVFKRLLTLNYPETLRIGMGITGLIMNSITYLSFPW